MVLRAPRVKLPGHTPEWPRVPRRTHAQTSESGSRTHLSRPTPRQDCQHRTVGPRKSLAPQPRGGDIMGLIDFVRSAGEKLFGASPAAATPTQDDTVLSKRAD